MHGHKDEWIRDRVKWKLADYKLASPEVLVFGEGAEGEGTSLRRIAELRSAGLPILAFWRSDELWTLLGSEKIVWRETGKPKSYYSMNCTGLLNTG